MCGIFGVLLGAGESIPRGSLHKILDELFLQSESRGKEASGLATFENDASVTLKQPITAAALIRSKPYQALWRTGLDQISGPAAFIGHSRLVTNGSQNLEANNQPVSYEAAVAVHNGIIVNVDELWEQNPQLDRKSQVDSELIPTLLTEFQKTLSVGGALGRLFDEIQGAASIAALLKDKKSAVLGTNTGSLYYCRPNEKTIVFASEKFILDNVLSTTELGRPTVSQLRAGSGLAVSLDAFKVDEITLKLSQVFPGRAASRLLPTLREALPSAEHATPLPKLRRCTKCVLPETMPEISFDAAGVCNYCREYVPMKIDPREQLEQILSPFRSTNGEPDCLIAFSGGRDSSYGLHLLKKELGMNPIAMTYDWGMVTDLARRNQARMCGTLGVEHILISANLEHKRSNIGKNIKAWLKDPALGMIPLFMAGDKAFFYHANRVQKQTGVKLVIFCVNPLEQTQFKIKFAGVSKIDNAKFYSGSLWTKLRMAFFYGYHFLKNPGYLNSSLPDTLGAYVSTYFLPHDYVPLYNYIHWDEDEINRVLIEQYDWEIAKDTTTTWRIGDGTAAFYNYIYYRIAGFTENDTFRSNQIREGLLTRPQALTLVATENKPRYESIREYLALVGLDFDRTMETIDRMRRLYDPTAGKLAPSFGA